MGLYPLGIQPHVVSSGDATPCRMTGVILHSGVSPELGVLAVEGRPQSHTMRRQRREKHIGLQALCPPRAHTLGYIEECDQEEGTIEPQSHAMRGRHDGAASCHLRPPRPDPPLLRPHVTMLSHSRDYVKSLTHNTTTGRDHVKSLRLCSHGTCPQNIRYWSAQPLPSEEGTSETGLRTCA